MGPRPLLALTLHRPWASLIVEGVKPIENRKWHPEPRLQAGEWFAIHAGKTWDDRAIPMAQGNGVPLSWFTVPRRAEGIVGVVRYAGFLSTATECSDKERGWWLGPIAWMLEEAVAIPPIPCRGYQHLWTVPPNIADQVRAAYAKARKERAA
jgi:hypothetical protein